jgi:hypothetical protein
MKAYNAPDNKHFGRTFWRDVFVLLLVTFICATGIVLTLKYSIEYGW